MSYRGSFVTSYIDCPSCFDVMREGFMGTTMGSFFMATVIPSWSSGCLPIIAGKVGSLHTDGEFVEIEERLDQFSSKLCHEVRVAVLAEGGHAKVFTVGKKSS